MCGIAGLLGRCPDGRRLVEGMTEALAHRGPDGHGVADLGFGFLGHRRLSIIDLSALAAQPMWDSSGRYCIVFNGEIFNFEELRRDLRGMGVCPRSRSDTEVLLECLKLEGTTALDRLNGMWAFAFWDATSRELLLARDRFGKKPLYYHYDARRGLFAFASELRPLAAVPGFDARLSPDGVRAYLAFGRTGKTQSIVRDGKKLPRAHWLRVSVDDQGRAVLQSEPEQWWSPPRLGAPVAREEILAALEDAVGLRLRSDVPVGVFLSGGIDSSVIALLAKRHLGPGQTIRSFSLRARDPTLDESPFAAEVAHHLGMDHHEVAEGAMGDAALATLVETFDEPFADESALATIWLANAAREAGTPVVLTGDGGDEVFGGYGRYWTKGTERPAAVRAIARTIGARYPTLLKGAGRAYRAGLSPPAAYVESISIFNSRERAWLTGAPPAVAEEPGESAAEMQRRAPAGPTWRQLADLEAYLPEQLLVKVDRATMRFGVEARSPFLDRRLVELAFRSPVAVTKSAGMLSAFADLLPHAVFQRRKHGFSMPLPAWLDACHRSMESLVDDYSFLDEVGVQRRRLVSLWAAHRIGLRPSAHKLWALLALWGWYVRWHARNREESRCA